MMKLEPIKINITAAKMQFGSELSVNAIKSDLELEGAVVRGYREGGDIIMEISGEIDLEQIENVFEENGMYGIAEYIIDDLEDEDFTEEPEVETEEEIDEFIEDEPVVESKKVKRFSKALIEKMNSSLRPAKKTNKMVNLAEALGVVESNNSRSLTLDEVIDNMVGTRIDESIAKKAMNKIKSERNAVLEQYRGKLGEQRFVRILESLEEGSSTLYGNVKVNGKAISEYTVNELKGLLEKLNGQISEIERKISLNEGDSKKLNEVLEQKKRLQTMLDDEISYRVAFEHKVNEDEEKKDDFKDFNPEPLEKEEEPKEEDEESEDDEESEENPDEDSEEELAKIVITLKNMEAAESMKNDLVEAGVPEDVIVLEEIKEEESEEEEEETEDGSDEEKSEDEESEEKQEESVKVSGSKLNEEDGEESEESKEEDSEEGSEEESEEPAEESEEESEEVAVKLILTDTTYVEEMVEVLENEWGMSKEEFEELIGGEIVSEESEDEEESDEDEEKEDSEDKSEDDDMDFNPDEIFKNL